MITKYHIAITRLALENVFSAIALKTILKANIKQDKICNMIGHDHIHFDGSAFESGFKYIADQENTLHQALLKGKAIPSWQSFGRITHSWQDFFSHSNYVTLWAANHRECRAEEILIDEAQILENPRLLSGKNYGPIEFFALLPGLKALLSPLMPKDSHARMNLDMPSSGLYFNYAYYAAIKATEQAYEKIIQDLHQLDSSEKMVKLFKGQ